MRFVMRADLVNTTFIVVLGPWTTERAQQIHCDVMLNKLDSACRRRAFPKEGLPWCTRRAATAESRAL
jgi:hypothetical protein